MAVQSRGCCWLPQCLSVLHPCTQWRTRGDKGEGHKPSFISSPLKFSLVPFSLLFQTDQRSPLLIFSCFQPTFVAPDEWTFKKPNFRPGIVCMLMYLSVKSSHSWFGVNAPPWWSVRCQHLRTGHLQGGHFDPQAVVNKGADGCSHQRERRPRWASPARSQHVLRMHYGLE